MLMIHFRFYTPQNTLVDTKWSGIAFQILISVISSPPLAKTHPNPQNCIINLERRTSKKDPAPSLIRTRLRSKSSGPSCQTTFRKFIRRCGRVRVFDYWASFQCLRALFVLFEGDPGFSRNCSSARVWRHLGGDKWHDQLYIYDPYTHYTWSSSRLLGGE